MNKQEMRFEKYGFDSWFEEIDYERVVGYTDTINKLNKLIKENNELVFFSEFGICQIQDEYIISGDDKIINLCSLEVFQLQELIEDIYIQLNNNEIEYLSDYIY